MTTINIYKEAGEFAENKDVAKKLRQEIILPNLKNGEQIEFDFQQVSGVTQSFIHALISEAIRQYGDKAFENLLYKNANAQVKEIIKTVYEYMQESLDI